MIAKILERLRSLDPNSAYGKKQGYTGGNPEPTH